MKYQNIARELYKRTFFKSYVSANDLRRHNLHRVFDHINHVGVFFNDLATEGYLEKIGKIKTNHEGGRGRRINCWQWTKKAVIKFGGDI